VRGGPSQAGCCSGHAVAARPTRPSAAQDQRTVSSEAARRSYLGASRGADGMVASGAAPTRGHADVDPLPDSPPQSGDDTDAGMRKRGRKVAQALRGAAAIKSAPGKSGKRSVQMTESPVRTVASPEGRQSLIC
jgi:hypothetical protein